jgi:hypothetical protein
MPCPYFQPVQACATPATGLLPLGDFWTGHCRAVADRTFEPGQAAQYRLCNLGYARGSCEFFPAGEGPDAVRFTISRDDGQGLIGIAWVMERDHLPFSHGSLDYSSESGEFLASPAVDGLGRQALAYVRTYQRRKAEAFVR